MISAANTNYHSFSSDLIIGVRTGFVKRTFSNLINVNLDSRI